ncbi:MAG: hypothetical protein RBT78_08805, partial [Kiritimatiellia bacterium]|nr:hypothetical protein [Kiritimatiellia bacterium]
MNPADAYFEDLLARVVEGAAAEDEFATFAEIIRQEPALRQRYRREMRLHALLCCKGGMPAPKVAATGWRRARAPQFGFPGKRLVAAAAAALLLGAGIGLLRLVPPAAPMRARTAAAHAAGKPVRLIRHSGAQGLELPAVLPGSVRLRQGVAVVRMPSGVELTLNGPLELAFESANGVEARLERGRLLAWVPPRAKGLIIRTRELEAWDIGTVFAVSADAAGRGVL